VLAGLVLGRLLNSYRLRNKGENMRLKHCPCCSGAPEFNSDNECYGHGSFSKKWWVECKCGMMTKSFPEGYEGTDEQCKEKAAKVWNKRM